MPHRQQWAMTANAYFILVATLAVYVAVFYCYFELKGLIEMTKDELEAKLSGVADVFTKASGEITKAVDKLKAELETAGATTPGIDAQVTRLEGIAAALDGMNEDELPEIPEDPATPGEGGAPDPQTPAA